jgi:hypothetical protein
MKKTISKAAITVTTPIIQDCIFLRPRLRRATGTGSTRFSCFKEAWGLVGRRVAVVGAAGGTSFMSEISDDVLLSAERLFVVSPLSDSPPVAFFLSFCAFFYNFLHN